MLYTPNRYVTDDRLTTFMLIEYYHTDCLILTRVDLNLITQTNNSQIFEIQKRLKRNATKTKHYFCKLFFKLACWNIATFYIVVLCHHKKINIKSKNYWNIFHWISIKGRWVLILIYISKLVNIFFLTDIY